MTSFRRIVTNTTYRGAAEVASKVISFAFYVVVAREVGDTGFGVFTFALALGALTNMLANFGQDAVLARSVARNRRLIDRYYTNTLALKLVLAVPALVATIAATTFLTTSRTTQLTIAFLGLAVLFEALLATTYGTLLAYERMGFIAVTIVGQRFVTAAVGIPLLVVGGSVVTAAAVYLGGAMVAFAASWLILSRKVVRPQRRLQPRQWPALMREALPVGLGHMFSMTLFRVDALILAAFATTAVVGEYGAAYRLFETTLFLSWSVSAASYASFARLEAVASAAVRHVYERAAKLVVIPTMPLATAALVLGPALTTVVYGNEFEQAASTLMLLAPAIALYPIQYVTAGMLVAQDRQRPVAIIQGAVAAGNIGANLIAIPLYSLYGAAVVTSASELALVVSLLVVARRVTGSVDWKRVMAGPVAASLAAGLVMVALRDTLPAALAAGVATYLVSLAAWERLTFPDDARAVAELFRTSAARR